ncbi:hypothetical protein [Streptomyces sp. NPDC001714]|uniref:hypothetical protein n=1 Tax=Streptomyces sp. NPDC001714 TaxID=3364603 RepID=UPI0036ACB41D
MAGDDLENILGSLLGDDGAGAGMLTTLIGAMSHGQGGGSLGGLLETLAKSGPTVPKDLERLSGRARRTGAAAV